MGGHWAAYFGLVGGGWCYPILATAQGLCPTVMLLRACRRKDSPPLIPDDTLGTLQSRKERIK